MSRIHAQSAIRYEHDKERDVLFTVERRHHVAYELGAKCSCCNESFCFPDRPLEVHLERAEAAFGGSL